MDIEDRKKSMALLQRSRGEIAKALREVIADFKRLGIDAYVKIPDVKEKLAYIIIPNSEIVNFMIRKISSYLSRVDRNIRIKGGIVEEFVAVKAICTNNVRIEDIDSAVSKFTEELKKKSITSAVNVSKEDYVTVNVMVNYIDIGKYLNKEVSESVRKKNLKVGVAGYVDEDMFVVRITPRD